MQNNNNKKYMFFVNDSILCMLMKCLKNCHFISKKNYHHFYHWMNSDLYIHLLWDYLKKIVSLKSVLRENNSFLSNVLRTKSAYLRNTLVSSCATLRRSAGKSDMISSIVTECVGSMAWLRSDSLLLWVHYSTDLSEQLLRGRTRTSPAQNKLNE